MALKITPNPNYPPPPDPNRLEPVRDPLVWLEDQAARLAHRGFPQRQLDHLVQHARTCAGWPQWPLKGHTLDELAIDLLDGFFVVLLGDHGRGKTTLATMLAWRALHHDMRRRAEMGQRALFGPGAARFSTAQGYIEDVRERGFTAGNSVEKIIRADAQGLKLLVLDEFHLLRGTDDDHHTLDRVINARYEAKAGTIIVSNMRQKEFQDECLRRRNVSRFDEAGTIITCEGWPDYRKGKR